MMLHEFLDCNCGDAQRAQMARGRTPIRKWASAAVEQKTTVSQVTFSVAGRRCTYHMNPPSRLRRSPAGELLAVRRRRVREWQYGSG